MTRIDVVSEAKVQQPVCSDIPANEGWDWARLGDVGDYLNGRAFKSTEWSTTGRPIIRIQDLTRSKANPNYYKGKIEDRYIVRPGDLLISWSATLGAYIWDGPEGVLNQHIFKVTSRLDKLFHFYLVQHFLNDLLRQTHGSGMVHVTKADFNETPVPIPPIAEQRRIVRKLDDLSKRVNFARDHLSRVPAILKRFRQAVLAAACSGRLTAEWREEQSEVEPATLTLERVRHKRSSGKQVNTVAPVDSYELPDLPDSWTWTSFGVLLGELRNGISTKPELSPPGVSMLRISSVRSGRVSLNEHRFLPHGADLLPEYGLRDGDLVFTRYNGTLDLLGVCGMVRGLGRASMLYPDKLMRVRFDHDHVFPAYAELFFQSAGARDRLTAQSRSSAGQQGVSGADIKSQPFALPPFGEQVEIVDRVSPLLTLADTIENRLEKASMYSDKLTQSILAKAFRGELVITEAELARQEGREYEPASVLLERIKGERTKEPKPAKRGRKAALTAASR